MKKRSKGGESSRFDPEKKEGESTSLNPCRGEGRPGLPARFDGGKKKKKSISAAREEGGRKEGEDDKDIYNMLKKERSRLGCRGMGEKEKGGPA